MIAKKIKEKIEKNSERGARLTMMEELFYDFNRSRLQIYKLNFTRGIFFGFGSVLGGTIVIALLIWVLNSVANTFPPAHDFFKGIIDVLNRPPSN